MNILQILILTVISLLLKYTFAKTLDFDEALKQISKSGKCTNDLKKLCKLDKDTNDIEILICFQESEDVMRQISDECQHYLWDYKHKLTTSNFFDKIVKDECTSELVVLELCQKASIGYKVPCLMDHKDKITDAKCLSFLDIVGVIVFSDYHLIYRFMSTCSSDIKKLNCGRITKSGSSTVNGNEEVDNSEKSMKETGLKLVDYVTSQAHTLDCLLDSMKELDEKCRHQMLRLAELQSNDYHLNRGLYYACQDDRERLCRDVKSGEGRVYRCLVFEKFNEKMSTECREELTRKQQIESVDARVNYQMMVACKSDIKENHCMAESPESDHYIVQMSEVMLCLRSAETNGKKLDPSCHNELTEKRKEIIEDLQISPETLLACKSEFQQNCKQFVNEPGSVVHCLMKLAQPNEHSKYGSLSKPCQDSLESLLQVSDPSDDVMTVDASIKEACTSSYMALCSHVPDTKGAFQCLVDNIESPQMTKLCSEKLSSLLYFMGMDIRIDGKLNDACHEDAVKLCNGPNTIEATRKRTKEQAQSEYYCMYQNYKKDRIATDLAQARGVTLGQDKLSLSTQCTQEIYNMIKIQALKVEFHPKVFVECFDDLSRFCGGDEFKGKEFQCLQDNIKRLGDKCHNAIVEFSEMEDLDYRLKSMSRVACTPMVSVLCDHEKDPMECLVRHKYNSKMSTMCRAAIEHYQLLSLEEFHIDHRFASFCGPDIDEYCQEELAIGKANQKRNNVGKAAIVSCLSKVVTKELLAGNKHPLREECRRQFTFELIQRSSSVKLDPKLVEDCSGDIEQFCKKLKPDQVNQCLRENQDMLSDKCHQRLFRRERLEALDADYDGELQEKCSQMIDEHCHQVPGSRVFQCLHRMMKEPDFDHECRELILSRLERRMYDIRLNPGLMKDCSEDIKTHCHVNDVKVDKPLSGIEYQGKVIHCLRIQFSNNTNTLTERCRRRLLPIIIESHTNMRLDPSLRKGCADDISKYCKKEMSDKNFDPVNSVQSCLKHRFLRGELHSENCKEEVSRLLREDRADVHIDGEIFEACENSIMKLCRSESFGFGRKLQCLLSFIDDQKAVALIEPQCLSVIKERREMWSLVSNIESQSLRDLLDHITSSSTSVYLLSMLGLIVLALLLLGICCGRVSKKVLVDHKNK